VIRFTGSNRLSVAGASIPRAFGLYRPNPFLLEAKAGGQLLDHRGIPNQQVQTAAAKPGILEGGVAFTRLGAARSPP
jgi:hypothetical protein